MVQLLKGGQPFKMSKRSGNFVTLADVVEMVGVAAEPDEAVREGGLGRFLDPGALGALLAGEEAEVDVDGGVVARIRTGRVAQRLLRVRARVRVREGLHVAHHRVAQQLGVRCAAERRRRDRKPRQHFKIGRASCRERVCLYV